MDRRRRPHPWRVPIRWLTLLVVAFSLIGHEKGLADRHEKWQDPLVDGVSAATPVVDATVAVLRSDSEMLSNPAGADAELSYAQIQDMVWLAIELVPVKGDFPLPAIISPGDWVVVTPQMTLIPPQSNNDSRGEITDPRVVLAVLEYLGRFTTAGRISLAMSGDWKGLGSVDLPHDGGPVLQDGTPVDGFTVTFGDQYSGFVGNYASVMDSLADAHPGIRWESVDLNYDLWPSPEAPQPVPVPVSNGIGGLSASEYYVSNTLLSADFVISVPAMKVDDDAGVSLSLMNYEGTQSRVVNGRDNWSNESLFALPGGIDLAITDLVSYHPPDFVVIGGIWGLEGGPHIGEGGRPLRQNLVLAGRDPVATDAVATTIMDYNPWDIAHLRNAWAKGFGTLDETYINVTGDALDHVRHPFDKAARAGTGLNVYYGRANRLWLLNGLHDGADLSMEHLPDEADLHPREGQVQAGAEWISVGMGEDRIDLLDYYHGRTSSIPHNVVSYAFTDLMSQTEQDGYLWIGSAAGIKVWLNGEMVLLNEDSGGHHLAQDRVPIRLAAGTNRLLLKIRSGTAQDYSFSVAIVDEDGDTLPGLRALPEKSTWIETVDEVLPAQFELDAAFPNPFNSDVVIPFRLATTSSTQLLIHNDLGQSVATILDGHLTAGNYRAGWDGRDDAGHQLASGVYFVR
ncbi:MAG: DUF362 domain-containing protein, partial [Gemmatimonadetes bacterium]|nr:DUF362 domain-containing protein [Gemmatimonadota bacterium]